MTENKLPTRGLEASVNLSSGEAVFRDINNGVVSQDPSEIELEEDSWEEAFSTGKNSILIHYPEVDRSYQKTSDTGKRRIRRFIDRLYRKKDTAEDPKRVIVYGITEQYKLFMGEGFGI